MFESDVLEIWLQYFPLAYQFVQSYFKSQLCRHVYEIQRIEFKLTGQKKFLFKQKIERNKKFHGGIEYRG